MSTLGDIRDVTYHVLLALLFLCHPYSLKIQAVAVGVYVEKPQGILAEDLATDLA